MTPNYIKGAATKFQTTKVTPNYTNSTTNTVSTIMTWSHIKGAVMMS